MSEKALPPLDLTGLASQVAERWRKWERAFEYFAEGKGIDSVRKNTFQNGQGSLYGAVSVEVWRRPIYSNRSEKLS